MRQESQLARLGLFDARVPRYTSYPTAAHFAGGVDAATFADWVRAIPRGAAISLYLHVPFCRRLCWFCACRTQGTATDSPIQAYVETLLAEIAMLGAILPQGVRLARLHWGGGTPTLLTPDLITCLAGAVADAVPLAEGAEFSVEIDPNEVDDARLDALVTAGMNRASIGVQDFDPRIQAAIGREQTPEITRSVAEAIRARGVRGLNADILYGLPHQTPASITASVRQLLSMTPDRVALYGYAHVPWMSKRQQLIPTETLPSPQARLDLFNTAERLFLDAGYRAIGIDHFALPQDGLAVAEAVGALRRNFQGYTDDTAPILIGLGASAISRFPQGFAQNAAATGAHVGAIRAGRFSTHRGHRFADEDHLRGRVIEALMCDFRVDRRELSDSFGATPAWIDAAFDACALAFPGMVRIDRTGLSVLPEGRPLTRMIARTFDAYEVHETRHSAAV